MKNLPQTTKTLLEAVAKCAAKPRRRRYSILAMTTKEKIIRQSIASNEIELKEIKELLEASPLVAIVEGRQKAQKLLSELEISDPRLSQEIGDLAKEEKRLFAIAKKKQNSVELIDRRIRLEFELADLHNELYWIERKKH